MYWARTVSCGGGASAAGPPLVVALNDPPATTPGRLTLVANFDFGRWAGQDACLRALHALPAADRVWLAQESRELPGAERALFAALPESEKSRWRFVSPERAGAPLPEIVAGWPGTEWLLTARYHAALVGAWARSKIVVISTNEKLRSAARDWGPANSMGKGGFRVLKEIRE